MTAQVHVLGVRHHGPGSARAVAGALRALAPDLVLVEGAPELTDVARFAASPGMVPPVAGLVYAPERPALGAFYPMASFSPEWQALQHALTARCDVRFVDLPAANDLALDAAAGAGAGARPGTARPEPVAPPGAADAVTADTDADVDVDAVTATPAAAVRADPLGALAAAAGFDDAERWWEDAIEHRYHDVEIFDVVLDAMRALRDADAAGPPDERNQRREAAMRRALRTALGQGHRSIAVVCGAWHAPALVPEAFPTAAADAALLKGLPKVKVAATWVPWTSARLARASGYGAGVTSPGWYEHLFTSPADVVSRWMVKVAALLREEQLDASSASVIDAVRLAEALATLRGRPLAGLAEVTEAAEGVLAGGSPVPLQLVSRRLLVGDHLGSVPDDTPMVPLARDLAALQKRLRMKVTAVEQPVELDLRNATHLERSRLLHRLLLVGVPWGHPAEGGKTKGTFKETWVLEWQPELAVAVIEASGAGTTVASAAEATVTQRAFDAGDLATLTRLVESCLLADLPDALRTVMDALADRSAEQHDTARLMEAVEPLARVRRYGDVRRADTEAVQHVLAGIVARVAIGLPNACASLDDDAAREMQGLVEQVHRGVGLLDEPALREPWEAALAVVADQRGVHGLVAGRATRALLDAGRLGRDDVRARLSRSLSVGGDPVAGAAWLEAFLAGDALLLLHDDDLLDVVDGWVRELSSEAFDDILPLLRRAFGGFSAPERRMIGDHLRRLESGAPRRRSGDDDLDHDRAARVLPLLRELLGAPS